MDSIILAAGRNKRLKGYVPEYHKPLLVVNGKPLIVQALEICQGLRGRIVIIVAPENSSPIVELVREWSKDLGKVYIIVQPEARGPGEALWRGLQVIGDEQTFMLCGDNLISSGDVYKMIDDSFVHGKDKLYVGGKIIGPNDQPNRFTRILIGENNEARFIEGGPGGARKDGNYSIWLGPLLFPTQKMLNVLEHVIDQPMPGNEVKIGPHLNSFKDRTRFIEVSCFDIGVPEALNGGKDV